MRKIGLALGIALFLASGVWLLAAPVVGPVAATPRTAVVGQSSVVTVTALIQDPTLIPTSVNLQRIDAAGKILGIVGTLNDAGLNGDAVAGDKVFTIRWSVQPTAIGQLRYQVSAGFRGLLRRVASSPVTLAAQVRLTVEPDAVRQTTQRVTSEGGTLSVDAADGTRFILSIPPKALTEPQDISITPILSIPNLPFSGGFRYGVQLQPEGLRLLHSATLEIRPSGALDYRHLIGFRYEGDGEGFGLALLRRDGPSIFMAVSQFSGDGIGEGTENDVSQAALAAIEEAAAYLESHIAAAIAGEAILDPEGGWDFDPGEYEPAIENEFLDWYNAAVLPPLMFALDCGRAGCETLTESIAEAWFSYLRWRAGMVMLGMGEDGVLAAVNEEYETTFKAVVAEIFDLENSRCAAEAEFCKRMATYEALMKQGTLLDYIGQSWAPPDLTTICGGIRKDVMHSAGLFPDAIEVGVEEEISTGLLLRNIDGEVILSPAEKGFDNPLWSMADPTVAMFRPLPGQLPLDVTVHGLQAGSTTLQVVATQCDTSLTSRASVTVGTLPLLQWSATSHAECSGRGLRNVIDRNCSGQTGSVLGFFPMSCSLRYYAGTGLVETQDTLRWYTRWESLNGNYFAEVFTHYYSLFGMAAIGPTYGPFSASGSGSEELSLDGIWWTCDYSWTVTATLR
jgi:hypothetical protein